MLRLNFWEAVIDLFQRVHHRLLFLPLFKTGLGRGGFGEVHPGEPLAPPTEGDLRCPGDAEGDCKP